MAQNEVTSRVLHITPRNVQNIGAAKQSFNNNNYVEYETKQALSKQKRKTATSETLQSFGKASWRNNDIARALTSTQKESNNQVHKMIT